VQGDRKEVDKEKTQNSSIEVDNFSDTYLIQGHDQTEVHNRKDIHNFILVDLSAFSFL
jgi:hypothetical protein